MMKHSRWMLLAMAGVLLSTADADAFGRRRRGCNGCNGGGCFSSCHGGGGCHGGRVMYNGCHGGCHGGRVISSGCHGGCHGGTVYSGSGGVRYGSAPRESYYPQGGERLPQPRRDDFNENGSETGQILFRAPQGAQVWVDGQLVERRGDSWVWISPALTGRRSFEVRARWNDNGRVVNRTRTVNIQSGGRTTLDFNRAEGSEIIPAAGESDRGATTPNTPPRPRDAEPQPQPRPGTTDLEPRNPATPRNNNTTPAPPNKQPRPEDR
jgi:uncharacterized protein (TIGR03000 family)